MSAIKQLEKSKIKNTPLLLEVKQPDATVKEYKDKLKAYGITNSTVKSIDEAYNKVEEKKREIGKKQALNVIVSTFMPFAVIEYATLDAVCKDHELVIGNIKHYEKAIPDENIEEIDMFVNLLKGADHSTLNSFDVIRNSHFSFTTKHEATGRLLDSKYNPIGTEHMFKVAAPLDHFSFPKNTIKIGNEINYPDYRKSGFKLNIKANKPKPNLDPIVFVPMRFMDKLYCIVVTAWDKVADDSRILSKL